MTNILGGVHAEYDGLRARRDCIMQGSCTVSLHIVQLLVPVLRIGVVTGNFNFGLAVVGVQLYEVIQCKPIDRRGTAVRHISE